MGIAMSSKFAQKITHFYCRPCGEYHPKTHPHYAEQQARAAERRKAKAKEERKQDEQRQHG